MHCKSTVVRLIAQISFILIVQPKATLSSVTNNRANAMFTKDHAPNNKAIVCVNSSISSSSSYTALIAKNWIKLCVFFKMMAKFLTAFRTNWMKKWTTVQVYLLFWDSLNESGKIAHHHNNPQSDCNRLCIYNTENVTIEYKVDEFIRWEETEREKNKKMKSKWRKRNKKKSKKKVSCKMTHGNWTISVNRKCDYNVDKMR